MSYNRNCDRNCEKVNRLGRLNQNQISLSKESQKGEVFLAMPNLCGTALRKVYIDNDQSTKVRRHNSNLRAVAAVARNQGKRAQVRKGKVIINDTPCPHDKLHRLPPQISPLLNMSAFQVEYDNEVYPTAEHTILATRAKFENNPTMEAIAIFRSDPFTVKNKAKRWDESTKCRT